jgi:hypothetical protein
MLQGSIGLKGRHTLLSSLDLAIEEYEGLGSKAQGSCIAADQSRAKLGVGG